jgi:uncharacterized protein involved in response to NO
MLTIDTPRPAKPIPSTFALWNLGFRPFYLLASIFAAASVLLWVCQYEGLLPAAYLLGPAWHGHEMLFGYTMAVVAGFLFTAVRNWTGQPTPTGVALAAIAALWVLGRILVLTPFAGLAAAVNAAFPLAVALGIGIPLAKSGNRRNYFFVALLAVLALAVLAFHLSQSGVVAWPVRASLQVGLDVVLFVVAVMGGRVIPMFTNNGIPGTAAKRDPRVEKAALGSIVLLFVADLVGAPATAIAVIALAAAAIHAVRLALWQPWRTLGTPLVWVLHAAYAWVVVYFVLRAFAEWDLVAVPLATHALTIGVIGGMTIGMITRTARGHTGRPLVADRFEVACYALVQIAAVVRVVGPLVAPRLYLSTVAVSCVCWSAAFTLYAIRYWPVLTRSRLDGKPG